METVVFSFFFFFQAEVGIRDGTVTGVQTCALPISRPSRALEAQGRQHAEDDDCAEQDHRDRAGAPGRVPEDYVAHGRRPLGAAGDGDAQLDDELTEPDDGASPLDDELVELESDGVDVVALAVALDEDGADTPGMVSALTVPRMPTPATAAKAT